MVLHAIILEAENRKVAERVKKHYPASYLINNTCFLVRTDDISAKVATNAGIDGVKEIEDASGVVLKLNGAHSGFAPSSLWEWLALEEEK